MLIALAGNLGLVAPAIEQAAITSVLISMLMSPFLIQQTPRLVRLLIEKVVLSDSGLEIVWCDAGWQALSAELSPGTIGAELAEMEAA